MVIGVKLGSKTLTNGNGVIYESFIEHVCRQIALLKREKKKIFLVSSGAVACDPCKGRSKNLRAAKGQGKLFRIYDRHLEKEGLEAAQLLLTDRDLTSPYHTVTENVLWESLDDPCSVPIINANDVVYSRELKALEQCADNDVLFKLVCQLVGVDTAVIGVGEKGFCDHMGMRLPVVRRDQYHKIKGLVRNGNNLGHGQIGRASCRERV